MVGNKGGDGGGDAGRKTTLHADISHHQHIMVTMRYVKKNDRAIIIQCHSNNNNNNLIQINRIFMIESDKNIKYQIGLLKVEDFIFRGK